MKISSKSLLLIDKFFWLPHRLLDHLPHFFSDNDENSGNPVLVIKFMGIGSIARWAALVEEHRVDKSKVIVLTFGRHRELCELFGFTGSLFIRTETIRGFFADCWKVMRAVKKIKPSWIVDYERCSHSVSVYRKLLAWQGKSKSISFESGRKSASLRQIVYSAEEITLEELFIKGIVVMAKMTEPRKKVVSLQIQLHKILVNINASDYLLHRRYSRDSFANVIRSMHLLNDRLEFYFTGAASENTYVDSLLQVLPGIPVYNTSGKWNFEKLMTELADCALFITGDSGPLHLAFYMNVPALVLWGPTQPHHFGYQDHPQLHHLTLNLPCSPCFKHPASRPALFCKGKINCLSDLAHSTVVEKALHLLNVKPAERFVHFPPGMQSPKTKIEPTLTS